MERTPGTSSSLCVHAKNRKILVRCERYANRLQTAQRRFAVPSTHSRIWFANRSVCSCTPLFSRHESLFTKLKELFRGRRFPTLNDPNLALTRRIRELNSNGLLAYVRKLPDRWKCVIEARGDCTEQCNVKIDSNE